MEPISILIGADMLPRLLTSNITYLTNDIVAMETHLGWTLMGRRSDQATREHDTAMVVISLYVHQASVADLWKLDTLGITDPIEKETKEMHLREVEDYFVNTTTVNEAGRYEIALPWKQNHPPLVKNRELCFRRLLKVTEKLKSDNYFDAYNKVFVDCLNEGIIEKVTESEYDEFSFYLPHRPVIKLSSSTTPIRPVFDASAHVKDSPSLNQCLETGPNLIEFIRSMILRFREKRLGFIADIRKAFLMISIRPSDRDFVRFLWWSNNDCNTLQIYRHARVVFGLTSSPFLLGATIKLHLERALKSAVNMSIESYVIGKLLKSFYVDNCVCCVDDEDSFNIFRDTAIHVMASGGFDLRCWEHTGQKDSTQQASVLGMAWDKTNDTLSLKDIPQDTLPNVITKRVILSFSHRIFDCLGMVCPVLVYPKLLLRKLSTHYDWDTPVSEEDRKTFTEWDLRFNNIEEIKPGAFRHLRNLLSLLLNDNKIKELRSGVFYGVHDLKYLYLYRNNIQHIDPDVFHGMIFLEQLYLQANQIHDIDAATFTNLPSVERLYLHNNLLTKIPYGSFEGMSSLKRLRLDSNALVCDCTIKWFLRKISENASMNVHATCYSPPHVTGVSVSELTEKDLICNHHPEIKQNPKDITVYFGDQASFSCVATGNPAPEITWYRDSVQLLTAPQVSRTSRYEVKSNGTLMIHDVDESAAGVFECMAKNSHGEVKSKPARMTVHKRELESTELSFIIQPFTKYVNESERNVSFDCIATGIPKPNITWLFNGEKLAMNDRTRIESNGTIIIKNVKPADVGEYTCLAENNYGKIAAVASLKTYMSPAFTVKPEDAAVTAGENVNFKCEVSGEPTPIISWYFNTLNDTENLNTTFKGNNSTLSLYEVSKKDEGRYSCSAESVAGYIKKSAYLTIVNSKRIEPRIVFKPEDTQAYRGGTVTMPCEVSAFPPAALEWSKDGSRIGNTNKISVTETGSLIITNVTVNDTGRYECSAYNVHGRDTATVFLTVKDYILPSDEYINIAITQAIRDIDEAIHRTLQELFNNEERKADITALYKLTKFPNSPEREVAKAAEIYERTLDTLQGYMQGGVTVRSSMPFIYENVLTAKHLEVIATLSGCVAHRDERSCSNICFHMKFRSIDGSCNNFENPMWGASLTAFTRLLSPTYENGFSQPVGWNKDKEYNGFKLPSARLISITVITTINISEDDLLTHMVMQWGQWLDHDMDHALPSVSSQTWDGVDCKKTCDYAAPCFPIDVPANDTRITNRRCIDFIRTSAVCGSGETSVLFGKLQAREQINQLTSFIDASQVYGFDKSVSEDLRDLTSDKGLLRVGVTFPGKKPLLPTTGVNSMDCRRNLEESNRDCFVAGDIRANEQIGLTAMHTIWMREHNRVASELKLLNKHWDGNRVYHETRKIIGAQMQIITYEHWLPLILGPDGMKQVGQYKGYNPSVNPSITNVFATAALRFGHSMINPTLVRLNKNFETIPQGNLTLHNAFFAPWRLVDEGGVDPLLRGMFISPAKLKTSTENLNSELTEKLFDGSHAVSLDLAAINIQRGRDHALPAYTKWREFCNMTDVETFDDLANEIPDKTVRDKLKHLYGSVHNIDVWVGGILETQVKGGKVGPLFRCILVEQFKRLRDGDRFWYENPSVFTPGQLKELRKKNLATVLCDNGDHIEIIGENVFVLPESQQGLISCDDLPIMDMRHWVDCMGCSDPFNIPRQNTDSETIDLRVTDANDERFDKLEDSHINFTKSLKSLKKRIDFLEKELRRV